ncbi:MAG: NAD(P)/FAD-dependent oxidoreductase, partial [Bacillota bacterium]
MKYDVIVVGAGFAGLSLALRLPRELKVLVLEKKQHINAAAATTGLVTVTTKNLIGSLVDVDRYVTNRIVDICVVDPSFHRWFVSRTEFPWIFSTNTPELLLAMAARCGDNVKILTGTTFERYRLERGDGYPVIVEYSSGGTKMEARAKLVVGADGARSAVAQWAQRAGCGLGVNRKFLFACERVYEGDCLLGDVPDRTVYHVWFGSFSLGYGGWIAPNFIGGRRCFRIGLATYSPGAEKARLLERLVDTMIACGVISVSDPERPETSYGGYVPIGGYHKRVWDERVLLLGDAAGFCGAFSGDGIKGAVVSGLVAGELIPEYLSGSHGAPKLFLPRIEERYRLLSYYNRQLVYRFMWDRMTSNASFESLFRLCEREKSDFLNQFCDAKDKQASLLKG